MYLLVIGFVLLTVAGCATQELSWKIVGTTPGMTRQEFAQIGEYCRNTAFVSNSNPTNNLGVAFAQAMANNQAGDRFRLCLEAHGIQTADK